MGIARSRWRCVDRAAAAGFDTLLFTVDTPVARRAAARQAQRLLHPAAADPRHDPQRHPAPVVVVRLPHHPPLEFASLSIAGRHGRRSCCDAMDPTINFDDLADHASIWPGKIVVKGVQNVEDAVRLVDRCGVDGDRAVQPRRPPARPGADPVPPAAATSSARSARTPRSMSTPAS